MIEGKRLFDLGVLVLSAPLTVPMIAGIVVLCAAFQGGPVFFVQKRVARGGKLFTLVKFRSLSPDAEDQGVFGGEKSGRVTRLGRILRRTHLDELPQIWNILRGDMSFVGPRPPLPKYVLDFPEIYSEVLQMRPGLTGLATCTLAAWEARRLSLCQSAEKTEQVYRAVCVPRKARLDRIYVRRWSLGLDLLILWRTVTGRRRTVARAAVVSRPEAAAQAAPCQPTTGDRASSAG